MLDAAEAGQSVLLIAPTGGGKTLAGFLPSLVALAEAPRDGLHTLYVSPLKALATDIARNLTAPVEDMRLPIRIETRTGDTPAGRRQRQKDQPPHLLLTTPESLALLLSLPDAPAMFAGLQAIVIDEVHALAGTKRGDQLSLCLARLKSLAPQARRIGLSATVAHPQALLAYVGAERLIEEKDGAPPALSMMLPQGRLPWSGHMGLDSAPDIMARIRKAGMTIVFVNTRAQAELMFQALWRINEPTLPIALHHGSLDVAQRRRVEAAMAEGKLRANSASTGAASISSSRSARRKASPACCNASAAPITAWTKPPLPSSSPPTASRCWNARPRCSALPPTNSTAIRRGPAAWMCWRSICSGWRAARRSIPMRCSPRSPRRSPTPR